VEPDAGTDIGWRVEADFVESISHDEPVELTSFADGVSYMRLTEDVHRVLDRVAANNPRGHLAPAVKK
jgi:hypothetical protein